jgi:hypothetical protein
MELKRLIEDLSNCKEAHHQSGRRNTGLKLPETKGQTGDTADGIDADTAQQEAEHGPQQAGFLQIGVAGDDKRAPADACTNGKSSDSKRCKPRSQPLFLFRLFHLDVPSSLFSFLTA